MYPWQKYGFAVRMRKNRPLFKKRLPMTNTQKTPSPSDDRIVPDNANRQAQAHKKEGDVLVEKKDHKAALKAYIAALTAQTDDIEAHRAALDIIQEHDDTGYTIESFNAQYAMVVLAQKYTAHIQNLIRDKDFAGARIWCRYLALTMPENGEIRMMTAMIELADGAYKEATLFFVKALECDPDNRLYRHYVLHCLSLFEEGVQVPEIRPWIERFLQEPEAVDVRLFAQIWHRALVNDPAQDVFKRAVACKDYHGFVKFMDGLASSQQEALTCRFFLDGLQNLIVPDMDYEMFLQRLRRYLLEHETAKMWAGSLVLALAQQCYNNEYVFFETAQETEILSAYEEQVKNGTLAEDIYRIALLACYRPLFHFPQLVRRYAKWKMMLKKNLKPLRDLVRQQIYEPQDEGKLAGDVKTLEPIQDDVSQKVREQYEAHPYPRWSHLGYIATSLDDLVAHFSKTGKEKNLEILVAGCATGYHPIGVACKYPFARVTGIDLSRTSLSYAMRKAQQYKTSNLTLLQADILDAAKLEKQFDYIECIGVLHHMAEPLAGWRALCDVLKPDGIMRIGLYSETARRYVVKGRAYIKEHGFDGTNEGMRTFRQSIYELPAGHELKNLFKYYDFYTMSMCRDLLFHVQEHRYTIPRIKEELAALGLEFTGFVSLPAPVRTGYLAAYPDDPAFCNLEQWETYEKEHPDSFLGMYVFNCRKAAGTG